MPRRSRQSVLTVARALIDLEQPLLGEAGAEAAIVRLVEATAPGGPSVASLIATDYLKEIDRPGGGCSGRREGRSIRRRRLS